MTITGNFAGAVKSVVETSFGEAGRADRPLLDDIDEKSTEPTRKAN